MCICVCGEGERKGERVRAEVSDCGIALWKSVFVQIQMDQWLLCAEEKNKFNKYSQNMSVSMATCVHVSFDVPSLLRELMQFVLLHIGRQSLPKRRRKELE